MEGWAWISSQHFGSGEFESYLYCLSSVWVQVCFAFGAFLQQRRSCCMKRSSLNNTYSRFSYGASSCVFSRLPLKPSTTHQSPCTTNNEPQAIKKTTKQTNVHSYVFPAFAAAVLTRRMWDRSNVWNTTNTTVSTKCEALLRTQPGAVDQPAHQKQKGELPWPGKHTHTLSERHRFNESQLWMVAWYSKTTINVKRRQDMLTH